MGISKMPQFNEYMRAFRGHQPILRRMFNLRGQYDSSNSHHTYMTLPYEKVDYFITIFVFRHLNYETDFSSVASLHFKVRPSGINKPGKTVMSQK
jgi:hypothetical protein